MAIAPHCKPSSDALRNSVHSKNASEDSFIEAVKSSKTKSDSEEKMKLSSLNPSGLSSCVSLTCSRVTCPVSRCPHDTCQDTSPPPGGGGSLPSLLTGAHALGDSNSSTPGRDGTAFVLHLGTTPSIVGDLLLVHVHVVLSVYLESRSLRRSHCLHVVFTRCMYVWRTGSQLLGCCSLLCVVMLTVRHLLSLRRHVILTWPRPGPEKKKHSDRDYYNHLNFDSLPCYYDGLITTDLTDHRHTPQTDTSSWFTQAWFYTMYTNPGPRLTLFINALS